MHEQLYCFWWFLSSNLIKQGWCAPYVYIAESADRDTPMQTVKSVKRPENNPFNLLTEKSSNMHFYPCTVRSRVCPKCPSFTKLSMKIKANKLPVFVNFLTLFRAKMFLNTHHFIIWFHFNHRYQSLQTQAVRRTYGPKLHKCLVTRVRASSESSGVTYTECQWSLSPGGLGPTLWCPEHNQGTSGTVKKEEEDPCRWFHQRTNKPYKKKGVKSPPVGGKSRCSVVLVHRVSAFTPLLSRTDACNEIWNKDRTRLPTRCSLLVIGSLSLWWANQSALISSALTNLELRGEGREETTSLPASAGHWKCCQNIIIWRNSYRCGKLKGHSGCDPSSSNFLPFGFTIAAIFPAYLHNYLVHFVLFHIISQMWDE